MRKKLVLLWRVLRHLLRGESMPCHDLDEARGTSPVDEFKVSTVSQPPAQKSNPVPLWTWLLTTVLISLLLLATYIYLVAHGFHVTQSGFIWPSEFTFIGGGGMGPLIFEVLYWSSLTVVVRRLHTLTEDVRGHNFHGVVYLNTILTDWLTTPAIVALVVFFLSFLRFDLGADLDVAVENLSIETVAAISGILAFFSDGSINLLKRLRKIFDNTPPFSPTCETCPFRLVFEEKASHRKSRR